MTRSTDATNFGILPLEVTPMVDGNSGRALRAHANDDVPKRLRTKFKVGKTRLDVKSSRTARHLYDKIGRFDGGICAFFTVTRESTIR